MAVIEECRRCGEPIDVRPTKKGTRLAIDLEKAPGGAVELREGPGATVVAVRVDAEPEVARYVEHTKTCLDRPGGPGGRATRKRGRRS
jgi:hypothetical protein